MSNPFCEKQLTVAELMTLLSTCPKDAVVFTEGCDCWGDAFGVEIQNGGTSVLITRIQP